jgi:hypothetical protein
MKRLLLTLLLSFFCALVGAQTLHETTNARPVDNFNLTILGNASLISMNYEKLSFVSPKFLVAFNIGMGYNQEFQLFHFGSNSSPQIYFTLPHYVTVNLGKGRHFFEFGLGGTVVAGNTPRHYFLYPIVGYRLQPLRKNKLYFRAFGQIPINGLDNLEVFFAPVGFSLGVCF